MWFTVGTIIGFFIGFMWFALLSRRVNQESVLRLQKENDALIRRAYLLEYIHKSRRSKKLRYKSSLEKKPCDDGSRTGS